MKLGIMGTGKIVQEALPVIRSLEPEKCFLMGREQSADRTRELCLRYGLDGSYLSPEDLLASDIDTVYIALPNQLHFSAAKQALAAGKHVILEKPAVPTVSELDALAAQARAADVFLLEAMTTPHLPAFRSLREQIPKLGGVRSVSFRFFQYSSRYDAFLEGNVAPSFDPACCGGALMDLNVYNIRAAVELFGAPQTASYEPHMQRGIDVSGIVTMDYGTFSLEAAAAKDSSAAGGSVIRGERADIEVPVPFNRVDRFSLRDAAGRTESFDFQTSESRLAVEFLEFERILREGDRSLADALFQNSRIVTGLLERLRPYIFPVKPGISH